MLKFTLNTILKVMLIYLECEKCSSGKKKAGMFPLYPHMLNVNHQEMLLLLTVEKQS